MTGGNLDSGRFKRDPSAKSLSYFSTGGAVRVDRALIEDLRSASRDNGNCNARVCLHDSPAADFHEMIILERGDNYCRPHRHPVKGESCHAIDGRVAVFIFGDDGEINDCAVLGNGNGLLFRIPSGRWHAVVPLSDPVIYHESKPGPFLGDEDREFPTWAPDGTDPESADAFVQSLKAQTGE